MAQISFSFLKKKPTGLELLKKWKEEKKTHLELLKKKWKEELKKRKKAGVIHVKNGVAATE
jgi:hypothetical protein